MVEVDLEQAERMIALGLAADVPTALWGKPGIGKSAVMKGTAAKLGWRYADIRLSDKEPTDLGGLPSPTEQQVKLLDGSYISKRFLDYLMSKILPYDTDEKVLIGFDEVDRTSQETLNAAIQLFLDREINGHKLSPNSRIVLAGNGTTDIGTTPLSEAAANRICHIHVTAAGPGALDSWLSWAEVNDVSPMMQGFAKFNQKVWNPANKAQVEQAEFAVPTSRSWVMADKLIKVSEQVNFKTKDILTAIVAGCVGEAQAREYLGYRDIYGKVPSPEEVVAHPDTAMLPPADRPDVAYAFSCALTDFAQRGKDDKEKIKIAGAIAKYAMRYRDEPGQFLMRKLLDKQPLVVHTDAWNEWNDKRLRKGGEKWTPAAPKVAPVVQVAQSLPAAPIAPVTPIPVIPPSSVQTPPIVAATPAPSVLDQLADEMAETREHEHENHETNTATIVAGTTEEAIEALDQELSPPKVSASAQVDRSKFIDIVNALNGKPLPDGDEWVNRVDFESPDSGRRYIISQNRKDGYLACSCRAWTTKRTCKHLDQLRATVGVR